MKWDTTLGLTCLCSEQGSYALMWSEEIKVIKDFVKTMLKSMNIPSEVGKRSKYNVKKKGGV